jgi:hypothetical protein
MITRVQELRPADQSVLHKIAEKLFWWKRPESALELLPRFLAQVMTLGTWDDVKAVERILGKEAFREVLRDAPAGVFDPRSWHYWHVVFGLPIPPPPSRRFE